LKKTRVFVSAVDDTPQGLNSIEQGPAIKFNDGPDNLKKKCRGPEKLEWAVFNN